MEKKKTGASIEPQPQSPAKVKAPAIGPAYDTLIKYFNVLNENDEPIYQVLDMFPIPIEIFAPDGTAIFVNRAHLDLNNIKDPGLFIGKYNLLKDPVCNDQLGMREGIQKAFRGEPHVFPGFPVPIDDLVKRSVVNEKPYEAATMDYYLYPIWKDEQLFLVVCVFVVRNLYLGRPDVAKAKEYIDKHWQGEYDPEAVAKSVNMSVTQLYRLFKEHTGLTPGDYHKKAKVEHIKEKLADKNLSIKEAFAACGEDSRGWMLQVFKEMTGMTPTKYREQ